MEFFVRLSLSSSEEDNDDNKLSTNKYDYLNEQTNKVELKRAVFLPRKFIEKRARASERASRRRNDTFFIQICARVERPYIFSFFGK